MEVLKHHHHHTVTGTVLPSGTIVVPTSTISVNPPGGTGHPAPSGHFPAPTEPVVRTPFHSSLAQELTVQPEHHFKFIHAHHTGHIALWVIFALFTAGLLGVFVLAHRVEKRARIFHWCVILSRFPPKAS